VAVQIEAPAGGDDVVVPHQQRAEAVTRRIVVVAEAKVIAGVQPVVVEAAELGKGSDFDHGFNLRTRAALRPPA
jgi:hypothetical protein